MLQEEMRIIDGKEFHVIPYSFFVARKLERTVIKIAAPLLAKITGSFSGGAKSKDSDVSILDTVIDGTAFSEAIESVFKALSEEEYIALLKSIFANTRVVFQNDEGKSVDITLISDLSFDVVFGTSVATMYKAIAYVAEVNFPDYFGKKSVIGQKISSILTSFLGKDTQAN